MHCKREFPKGQGLFPALQYIIVRFVGITKIKSRTLRPENNAEWLEKTLSFWEKLPTTRLHPMEESWNQHKCTWTAFHKYKTSQSPPLECHETSIYQFNTTKINRGSWTGKLMLDRDICLRFSSWQLWAIPCSIKDYQTENLSISMITFNPILIHRMPSLLTSLKDKDQFVFNLRNFKR